jgi:hypothetical protein
MNDTAQISSEGVEMGITELFREGGVTVTFKGKYL